MCNCGMPVTGHLSASSRAYPNVAIRYGHVEPSKSDVEVRLHEAREAKNWDLLAELSRELAIRNRGATG